jgi:hypothetical protein
MKKRQIAGLEMELEVWKTQLKFRKRGKLTWKSAIKSPENGTVEANDLKVVFYNPLLFFIYEITNHPHKNKYPCILPCTVGKSNNNTGNFSNLARFEAL